jgi:hypothetical protein
MPHAAGQELTRQCIAGQCDAAALRRSLAKHKNALVEIVAFASIGNQILRIYKIPCNLCSHLAQFLKLMLKYGAGDFLV